MTDKSFSDQFLRFIRQTWLNSSLYRFTLMGGTPKYLTVLPTDPWPGDGYAGRLLIEGKFMVGDQTISLTDLWMPSDIPPYMLANLHEFSWLRDLRVLGENSARRLARQLIVNWIDQNQDWKNFAWQIGVTGHRVANWIALYDFFCSSADENFRSVFFREIARQVRHLAYGWQDATTSLERLYALKGLIFAAITFPGEINRLSDLLVHLEKELHLQVLADGGHSSRDPQIHLSVLQDLIDIRAMLRLISREIPSFLQSAINQMAPIVRLFRHGDGGLATFGNHNQVSSSVVDMVLTLADVRGRPPERAAILGFERCVNKSSLILLNVGGKPPLFKLPGLEEGTGALNFEWSVGRDRFIVHGDVILQTKEGKNFQVPELIDPKFIQLYRKNQEDHALLDASYTCMKKGAYRHRRQLYLEGSQPNLRGKDTFEISHDGIYGIRFVLNRGIQAFQGSGKRGAIIRMTANGKKGDWEEQQWRLLVSGVEEVLCEQQAFNQTIFLLGRAKANEPLSIRWAFRQD